MDDSCRLPNRSNIFEQLMICNKLCLTPITIMRSPTYFSRSTAITERSSTPVINLKMRRRKSKRTTPKEKPFQSL